MVTAPSTPMTIWVLVTTLVVIGISATTHVAGDDHAQLSDTITLSSVHQTWQRQHHIYQTLMKPSPITTYSMDSGSSSNGNGAGSLMSRQSLLPSLSPPLSAQSLGDLTFLSTDPQSNAPHHTFTQTSCDTGVWMVTVKSPIASTWRQSFITSLASLSSRYTLGSYVGYDTYQVHGIAHDDENAAQFADQLRQMDAVLSVSTPRPIEKLSSRLGQMVEQLHVKSHSFAEMNVHDVNVHVLRAHVANQQSNAALAALWQRSMMVDNIKYDTIDVVSASYMDISVTDTSSVRLVSWLLHRADVTWLEIRDTFSTQNKYARYLIQDNVVNRTLIWSHGIRGENQIVALGDTGIDYDHCFFHDLNHTIPMGLGNINHNHRKIVTYVPIGDQGDASAEAGHGTHVAGSLAGEVSTSSIDQYNSLNAYNGMAYKAKLAFFDFKRGNGDALLVPNDIYKQYYGASVTAGASISSNSWGSPDGAYSSYCVDTDQFVWDHPDFLPIFAAGNYGEENGFFSLSTPGVSKNVLTVGACKSTSASFIELGKQMKIQMEAGIRIVSPPSIAGTYMVVPAAFGTPYNDTIIPNISIIAVQPMFACQDITNAPDVFGQVALVLRGQCPFADKVRRLERAGARLVIVVQDGGGAAEVMGPSRDDAAMQGDNQVHIPAIMITADVWTRWRTSAAGATINITAPVELPSQSSALNENVLASFSGRGPTYDGRTKPDVLAPGLFVVSARSDGDTSTHQCSVENDIQQMQGTSMATPIASGGTALVRQYFTEGWYPTGAPVAANSRIPSAALLKACVISSAISIGGRVQTKKNSRYQEFEVIAAPSIYQGYGRMQLNNVLSFDDTKTNIDNSSNSYESHSLWIHDQYHKDSLVTGDMRAFCFRVSPFERHDDWSSNGDHQSWAFRATLTWMDPPGVASASWLLVNNLDLFIIKHDAEGGILMGNGRSFVDITGTHLVWDDVNNVEQATVQSVPTETFFSVHVRATNVAFGRQPYALVVNGQFKEAALTDCSGPLICPNDCNSKLGFGTCDSSNGQCKCTGDHYGGDCSQISVAITGETSASTWSISSTVGVGAWQYFHADVNVAALTTSSMILTMKRSSVVGDPDMYVSLNAWPTVAVSRWKAAGCDSCAGATDSRVSIPVTQLASGRIRIGIHGYCCDDSSFILTITNPGPPVPVVSSVSSYPIWLRILILVTGLTIASILVYFIVRCRQRLAFAAHRYALTRNGEHTGPTIDMSPPLPVHPQQVQQQPQQSVAAAPVATAAEPRDRATPKTPAKNGYQRVQTSGDDNDHDHHTELPVPSQLATSAPAVSADVATGAGEATQQLPNRAASESSITAATD